MLPEVFFFFFSPVSFSLSEYIKKKCVRRADCPLSLLKKRGRAGHTQRDTSYKYSAQPLFRTAGHRAAPPGQMGFKLLCRRALQQRFLRVREHLSHNSPTQTFPASPQS